MLTDSVNPNDYIKKMKKRDPMLAEGWGQIVLPLSVQTPGGQQRVNCATQEEHLPDNPLFVPEIRLEDNDAKDGNTWERGDTCIGLAKCESVSIIDEKMHIRCHVRIPAGQFDIQHFRLFRYKQ